MKTKWTVKYISLKTLALLAAGGLATQLASGQPIAPPPGMIAWWPGDGNPNDIFGTNNGALFGGATASTTGEVGQAFDLNGNTAYIDVADSPDLDLPNGMTIELWFMPGIALNQQQAWARLVDRTDGSVNQFGWEFVTSGNHGDYPAIGQGQLGFIVSDYGGSFQQLWTAEADFVPPNQFSHLAATYDEQAAETTIYVNGQVKARGHVGSPRIPRASKPLRIGAATRSFLPSGAPAGQFIRGRIDEVSLYNRALSSNEVWVIYAAGAAGKCKDPIITQHPTPQTQIGYWGRSVTFTVTAKGTQPMRYQWLKNGVPLASATDSTLTLSNLQATNSGSYSVTVSNSVGTVTTYPGLLSVSAVEMNFALYGGIQMNGVAGQTYGVQSTLDLSNTNSWVGRANVTLTNATQLWYDSQPATQPQTYYRVLPGPISIP